MMGRWHPQEHQLKTNGSVPWSYSSLSQALNTPRPLRTVILVPAATTWHHFSLHCLHQTLSKQLSSGLA
ncbi:hypothetical protein E2C01_090409 [Portunus trituberculatus]|uniref:Uncharacterized protein n=1 Tax=Portunus trituberculatus TaxID=210409 RepID=A0A5B7JK66_PORTR|nr:hypothetical protein [Portunus trituberculatus]